LDSIAIVQLHAIRLGVEIEMIPSFEIARRGRGVPRILVRFLERARDFSNVSGKDIIDTETIDTMFSLMEIDQEGLTKDDVRILKCLYDNDTPIGLDTISVLINEATSTISHSMEPYLMQKGFMIRTSKGRTITPVGREYLEKIHDYK
jgi:Holliday junction DNA helicase RuvB